MSVSQFDKEWIGYGIQSPHPFNKNNGTVISNTGKYRIKQSIYYILSTVPGERFLLPQFGCRLHRIVFDPNTSEFAETAELYIREALNQWEPRIIVNSVKIDSIVQGNTIPITIYYRIRSTNQDDNYVYPFKTSLYPLGGDESEQ